MFLLLLFVYSSFIFLIRFSNQSKLSKRMLYVIISYWMLSLVISSLNPYHLNPVSVDTYFWMVVNVGSFLTGYLLYNQHINSVKFKPASNFNIDSLFKSKWFLLLLITCTLFTLYIFYQQRLIVLSYNIGYLRENFAELMFTDKPLLSFVYMTLLKAFYDFSLFLAFYLLVYKRDYVKIVLLLIFIVPFIFLSGGRTRALMLSFYLIFVLICNNTFNNFSDTKFQINFRIKPVIFSVLGIVLIFILFSYTSMLRLGYTDLSLEGFGLGVDKSLMQMCTYSVGPFRAFDQAIDKDYLDLVGGLKYGQASIGGIESFLERIFRHAFGVQLPNVNKSTLVFLQEEVINVGTNEVTDFNFAYTNAIYHYFDFGYIGIIVWPFLFGLFFSKYSSIAERYPSIPAFALLSFLFEIALYSVFSLLTVQPFAMPYIICLIVLIKLNVKKQKTLNRKLLSAPKNI